MRCFTRTPKYVCASSNSIVARFEVSKTYSAAMLYGGTASYTVVDRTEDTVTLKEHHVSEDTWESIDDGELICPIVLQDYYDPKSYEVVGTQESVLIWEYKGHEGYLYAGQN